MKEFNPPADTWKISAECILERAELLSLIKANLKIDESELEAIRTHGGIFLNTKRVTDIPKKLEKKQTLEVFKFKWEPQPIKLDNRDILFEDKEILAFNKPAWLPTQGTKVSQTYCLEYQLRKLVNNNNLMAIHRLDRETSGIVLFGKTAHSTSIWMKKFENKNIIKKYHAVVFGSPLENEWKIEGCMMRNFAKLPQVCFRLVADKNPKGKWSESTFKLLETRGETSLVEGSPLTGRTHQLRVHLAKSNLPIIGDNTYGNHKANKQFGSPRCQLHAAELKVEKLHLFAPPPKDFIW